MSTFFTSAFVKFLASRGLGFRSDDKILGSQNNGYYLGCLELISKFDPFLAYHIKKLRDLTHVDQLTFIIQFVKDAKPIEEHKVHCIPNTISNFFKNHDIPIKNYREQGYDNAANMAKKYLGV